MTKLPELPDKLESLDCSINKLTELPKIPDSLIEAEWSNNLFPNLTMEDVRKRQSRTEKLKKLNKLNS